MIALLLIAALPAPDNCALTDVDGKRRADCVTACTGETVLRVLREDSDPLVKERALAVARAMSGTLRRDALQSFLYVLTNAPLTARIQHDVHSMLMSESNVPNLDHVVAHCLERPNRDGTSERKAMCLSLVEKRSPAELWAITQRYLRTPPAPIMRLIEAPLFVAILDLIASAKTAPPPEALAYLRAQLQPSAPGWLRVVAARILAGRKLLTPAERQAFLASIPDDGGGTADPDRIAREGDPALAAALKQAWR